MNTKSIVAVLVGGVVVFIWYSISWMLLPWHANTMNAFKDEDSVGKAIKEATAEHGIYTYPGWTEDQEAMAKKHEQGPFVFASVVPEGVGSSMAPMMIRGFLTYLIGCALLLTLMLMVPDSGWKLRTLFATVTATFVSAMPVLANWNWWHFPIGFSVVGFLDSLIAWTMAGLVMAKIVADKGTSRSRE